MPAFPPGSRRIVNPTPGQVFVGTITSIAADASQGTAVCTLTENDEGESFGTWEIAGDTPNTKFELSSKYKTGSVTLQRSGTGTLTAGVDEYVTIRYTDRRHQSRLDVVGPIGVLASGGGNVDPTIVDGTANITDAYVVDQAVLVLAPSNNPSPATCSWSISSQTTASMFKVDGSGATSVLKINSTANLTAQIGTPQGVTVSVNNGGTPDTAVYTVNISADPPLGALDMMATATNPAGGTKNNQLVMFPVVMAAGEHPTGNNINIMADSSGAIGSELSVYQLDNLSSPRETADGLFTFAAAIDSFSDALGQTKKYHAISTSNAPPSGTAITKANVLATDLDAVITLSIGGVAYTWSLADALAGSETFAKTAYHSVAGTWKNGLIMSVFKCTGPAKAVTGGAAHASGDGIAFSGEITVWKATGAAVGVGNPILGAMVVITGTNRALATDYTITNLKVSRAALLDDATLISTTDTDYITRETITYDRTAETWTAHPGWGFVVRVHVGDKPVVALAGDHTSATSPTTSALGDLFSLVGITPREARAFAAISHDMEKTDAWPRMPSRNTTGSDIYIAEYRHQMDGTGGRPEIGVYPKWERETLVKPDADGLEKTMANIMARCTMMYAFGLRDQNNGNLYPEPYGATARKVLVKTAADPWSKYDTDHAPAAPLLPYLLLNGEHWILEQALGWDIGRGSFGLSNTNTTPFGNPDNTDMGSFTLTNQKIGFRAFQERGQSWTHRNAVLLYTMIPDRQTTHDFWSIRKSQVGDILTNSSARLVGVIPQYTDPGPTYNALTSGPGLRWLWLTDAGGSDGGYVTSPWMVYFGGNTFALQKLLRQGDANIDTVRDWLADGLVEQILTSDVRWQFFVGRYRMQCREDDDVTLIRDFATQYAQDRIRLPKRSGGDQLVQIRDNRSGVTATLSALSGSAIAVQFSADVINMTYASWYVGTHFVQHKSDTKACDTMNGKITAVTDARNITVDTTYGEGVAFTSLTLGNARWSLTIPHLSDATVPVPTPGGHFYNGEYMGALHGYLVQEGRCGRTRADSARAVMEAVFDPSLWDERWRFQDVPS